ncbi:toxin-antitoxin system HicB family antitoxin [Rudanella paleaurantiibacter]|uniref:Toxin-antitoxin system HicB family antitoxin n=1 Tax=Rudanella paleaurantiibacter TaxID=2614655 RepID=A0A7J5U4M5_9BACT|nr:toxin-antitoxin system HicB family antitoxin [Rudanella paleaurantiibacter]KAB7732653.1 toxin-antitoxin system HicB family antitoxin [Rudanella paleaurantiibacter]
MEKETQKAYLVRMNPSLHKQAEEAAKKLGLNFSAYVRYLISKDTNPPV